ncbi:MAG TPA: DUF1499 domain-containing protein [Burkholderiales bacterium]|jgi:uncharacterized protein (DUF1499 family)|nr:DUF1499 domain-containing protein [Burkholderiales bacterium]
MNTQQTSGASAKPIGKWLAVIGLVLAVACAAGAVLSGVGYRLDLWHFRTGFMIIRWAFFGALAAVLLSIVGLVFSMGKPRQVLLTGLLGILVGAVTAYIPWNWKQTLDAHPYIHDITTDVQNPPKFVAVIALRKEGDHTAEYDGPEVAEQQRQAYPDIMTLIIPSEKDKVLAAAEAALRAMKLKVVDVNAAEGRIEATQTSLLYGFTDDVVVRIVADGAGSKVDVRSKSRVGRSDLGQNAKRIRAFLRELHSHLP